MYPPQGFAALLEEALVVYKGATTSAGGASGATLVCSDLASKADWNGNQIIITSGDYEGQARDINGATNNATGTVTPANAFGGVIAAGVTFVITGIRTVPAEVAALQAAIDNVLLDTQLKFAVSGSHTFTTGLENFLNIDSGTDGAEIISITIKGIVGADWTVKIYVPTDDTVASPAAGDKRAEETYISTDTEAGQLTNIGAMRYNLFLDITNDSAGSDDIDEVIIAYRSRGTVTAVWEGA